MSAVFGAPGVCGLGMGNLLISPVVGGKREPTSMEVGVSGVPGPDILGPAMSELEVCRLESRLGGGRLQQ